jgi:hypothetical protein
MSKTRDEFTHPDQRFQTGKITIFEEAEEALKGCCGNAYEAMLTMHTSGVWPASTPEVIKSANDKILAEDTTDEMIVSLSRIGSGDIFVVATSFLPPRTRIWSIYPEVYEQLAQISSRDGIVLTLVNDLLDKCVEEFLQLSGIWGVSV